MVNIEISSTDTVVIMLALLSILSLAFLISIIALRLQYQRRLAFENRLRNEWEPLVIEYLSDEVTESRIVAAVGKGQHEKDVFARLVSEYLANLRGEEHEKLAALVGPTGLTRHELDALSKGAPWRAAVAALRLGLMGDRRAIPALRVGLGNNSPIVQVACADALAALEDTDSLEQVVTTLITQTEWNRLKTAEILVAFAKKEPGRILPFVFDASVPATRRALLIEALGEVNYREAETELVDFARGTAEPELVTAVIKYLGLVTALDSIDFLLKATDDTDWLIRSQAAKSLGSIADPVAVPVLVRLTHDSVWWVRYKSAMALANILPEGVSALEKTAEGDIDPFARDIADQALYESGEWQERAA